MKKFYFTFGVGDTQYTDMAYKGGHVEIHADSMAQACEKFRSRFYHEKHEKYPKYVHCSFMYSENEWDLKDKEKYPDMFHCWEVIE